MNRKRIALCALLGACGPVERLELSKGEPVENLVSVAFDSEVKGDGVLLWESNGREYRRELGERGADGWATTIWIPSGRVTKVRGAVRDRSGELVEGPRRRVRIAKPPKKIRWDLILDTPKSQIGDGVLLLNAYDATDSYASC